MISCIDSRAIVLRFFSSLVLFTIGGNSATAATLLADHMDGVEATTRAGLTRGLDFEVATPFLLTHLGIWDSLSDGLVTDHDVGLWSDQGSLLALVTVQEGLASELIASTNRFWGGWRFEPLDEALILIPGETYVVGAHYLDERDKTWFGHERLAPIILHSPPGIKLGSHRTGGGEGEPLLFPARDDFATAVFGANALLIPVPEPATGFLIGFVVVLNLLPSRCM